MTVREAIITLAEENFLSQEKLGYRLGYKDPAAVYKMISKDGAMNMKVSTLLKYLDAMDAQLIVQSIDTDTEVIIDGESEDITWARAEAKARLAGGW